MQLQERDFRTYFKHYFSNLRTRPDGQATVRCPFHDDRNPSLSINLKRGVWYCFGGCGGGGILEFETRKNSGSPEAAWVRVRSIIGRPLNGAGPEPVAVYDYTDETGKLQYQVLRLPGKKFTQRQPDGRSGWLWHLKGVRRVPYRLPELLKASRVFIPEGEKDVETVRSHGLVATTNSNGAGKWQPEFARYFEGKDVVILPDNDDPGRKHAEQVAATLQSVAQSIKVVTLPGLGPGGDVSDFCAKAGAHSKGLLLAAVEDAREWRPVRAETVPSSASADEEAEHLTDSGNARRIVNTHGQDVRYCPAWGKWLIWDATRWRPDETGEIVRRAQSALRAIYAEAERTRDKVGDLLGWAKRSEAQGKIQAAISLAQSAAEVIVTPELLDSHPWLLNCRNGTLDLRTGELRAHDRADLLTKRLEVEYAANATCPTFDRFLDKIMGGDTGLKLYLQTAIGYSLTGLTREQCVFILHGLGANGKSSLLEIVRIALGDYARNADFTTFAVRDRSGASGDLARLAGARFVTAVETEPGERLSLSRIKQVTGGDRVTARYLYQAEFEYTPQFKCWLAVNHKPQVRGGEHAIWRRIRLIPFTVTIQESEQDKDILEKLKGELPGILGWAVEGCKKWQKPGLQTPHAVLDATEDYREEMDLLGGFIEERCEKDRSAQTPIADLYDAYTDYCKANNEKPMGKNKFGTFLSERGFPPLRIGKKRSRKRAGIKLGTGGAQS